MTVGTRLKRLRISRGLTQRQLAEPHYSHAYVSSIEAGRRAPSRAALEHFATKLGIGPEELATGHPPDLAPRLELRLHEARRAVSAGAIDEAERTFGKIAGEASRVGLNRIAAKAMEGRALCEERRGHLDEAVDEYERVLEMLRGESPLAEVEAVAGKARCTQLRGDIRHSIYLLEMFLERLQGEGLVEPSALLRIHASLVRAYFDAGLYSKASESAAEALRLAPRVEDPVRLAQMYVNVALVSINRGDIDEAESALSHAEELYRQASLRTEIGRAYLARGFALGRADRNDDARGYFASAREIFEQTASTLDEARVLNELARLDRIAGRPGAVALLHRAISLLQENDVAELATAHRELALCYVGEDPDEAEKHFLIAIGLFERAEEATQLAATYRALGDLLHDHGRSDAGCDAYRTGILVLEERI